MWLTIFDQTQEPVAHPYLQVLERVRLLRVESGQHGRAYGGRRGSDVREAGRLRSIGLPTRTTAIVSEGARVRLQRSVPVRWPQDLEMKISVAPPYLRPKRQR